ncbi:MAG: RNA-binding protein [Planctomycetaceae bacterium]|nr:RNA-binding protein [Planctomycetaceae bacterium]
MSADFTIRLDQFLKLAGQFSTGGQAKLVIQAGGVLVNGDVETRRRRQLVVGDVVECEGQSYVVELEDDPQSGE